MTDRFRSLCRLLSLAAALVIVPAAAAQTPCVAGDAGGYACDGIDLMSHVPLSTFSTAGSGAPSAGSDIWGWTDTASGREFALMGLTNGVAFVEVTDPASPVFLGKLPTAAAASDWRDVKTYNDHAFIVAEASNHGMQVFDLSRLLTASGPAVTFTADARYTGFGKAHNIVIDEDSGLAYGVGANQSGFTCNGGGLHIVDISTPTSPSYAGCYDGDGYTHDAQCMVYDGPDTDYTGTPICVASNEDTVTIVDLTDPAVPVQIGRVGYPNPSYTHQGWFSDDGRWFIVNDELDGNSSTATRTIVMDLLDLDDPSFGYFQSGTSNARDHNLYVLGDQIFQSNYNAGLRVLDAAGIAGGTLPEVAFFDTYPANDSFGFNGQWSNYPYFPSGTVIASDIEGGLFAMALAGGSAPPVVSVTPASVDATVAADGMTNATVTVANTAGPEGGSLFYSATVQNLSQPSGSAKRARVAARPVAAQPVVDAPQTERGVDTRRPAPRSQARADGGPDAFGYAWTDSDEAGGPAVAFQDISASGTALTFTATGNFPAGDEGYADVTLPFAFPYYGADQTSIRIFTNGFAAFTTFAGNSFNNGALPASATPNGVIAPFWDDLDQSVGGTVYTGALADGRFVIQWDAVPRYDTSQPVTFQAILSADGGIEFQYGTMNGTLSAATVGIENTDGTIGLQVANNETYVTSDRAIRFGQPAIWASVSPTSGTVAPGASAALTVTLDADGLPEGTYTGELVIASNDGTNPSITVPLTLTVADGPGAAEFTITTAGAYLLAPPAAGFTVDDLAVFNLVIGVPGYNDATNRNLLSEVDGNARFTEGAGVGDVLEIGRGFRWIVSGIDRDYGSGSISRPFPTTLTEASPNTADVTLDLQTQLRGINIYGNPFGVPLDISGISTWPNGTKVSANVFTWDVTTKRWVFDAGVAEIAPWQAFFVRTRPGRTGTVTIPASAAVGSAAWIAASESKAPTAPRGVLRFDLDGTALDGAPLSDGAFALTVGDAAEAEPKLAPLSNAYVAASFTATDGLRAIEALTEADLADGGSVELPVAIQTVGAERALTLRWDAPSALPTSWRMTLVDLSTGATADLSKAGSYAFEADSAPTADAMPDGVGVLAADGSVTRFVIRIEADGVAAKQEAELSLSTPQPNPVRGSARVPFTLAEAGAVRLSVYDALGREVAVLADGAFEAGAHSATLSTRGLAVGVYVVRLATADGVLAQRVTVSR